MFVVFEGLDGTGKSTQVQRFSQWLSACGKPVRVCREPGSTPLGEGIRELLLHKSELRIDPISEMLLFMAARSQLVREVIRPALNLGEWVICDRFQWSTLAYQGYAGGIDLDWIRDVGDIATGGLKPDLTFLLDLEPSTAFSRVVRELDRMESRGIGFWTAVREGFLSEIRRGEFPAEIVDADRSIDQIASEIQQLVKRHFASQFAEER